MYVCSYFPSLCELIVGQTVLLDLGMETDPEKKTLSLNLLNTT